MTTTPAVTTPAHRRNPALVALDIVAGVLIALVGLGFGFVVLALSSRYTSVLDGCGAGPYDGLTCNEGFVNGLVIALLTIVVFAWCLSIGMFIVRLLRRRVAFFWPLIGAVVIIVAFYAGTILVAQVAP